MNKIVKQIIFMAIGVIITGIGASLTVKAAVGIGAWDALSLSVSSVIGMKIGTFSMIMNISCVVVQLIMLGKKFKPLMFLQVFVAVLLGYVVNFMLYDVLSGIVITQYYLNMILYLFGLLVIIFGVANVMTINFISFPLEGACIVIADRYHLNFGKVRQWADILSVLIAIAVALIFRNDLTVREGTIIGMFIFGPLLHQFMVALKPGLTKLDLVS
jgi:uncharacterized membrane protein YczE